MDLTPQEPAEGIALVHKGSEFQTYRVECSCGSDDDAIMFEVEGSEWQDISVTHYTTQKTPWWQDPFKKNKSYNIKNEFLFNLVYYTTGFLNALSHRLKVTWSVWAKGYVEYQSTTILTKQQALNYASTLQQAIKELDQYNVK